MTEQQNWAEEPHGFGHCTVDGDNKDDGENVGNVLVISSARSMCVMGEGSALAVITKARQVRSMRKTLESLLRIAMMNFLALNSVGTT